MTQMPEDILIKARAVTNKLHCFMPEGDEIVALAILAERERCFSKVTRPDPSDLSIPLLDEQELLERIRTLIRSGEA